MSAVNEAEKLSGREAKTIIKTISIIVVSISSVVGFIAYVEAKFASNQAVVYIEKKVDRNAGDLKTVKQEIRDDIRDIRNKVDSINKYILTKENSK